MSLISMFLSVEKILNFANIRPTTLGNCIDENLTFNIHNDSISLKARRQLYNDSWAC